MIKLIRWITSATPFCSFATCAADDASEKFVANSNGAKGDGATLETFAIQ